MAGLQSRDSNGAVNHKSAPNPSSQSCPYLKNNKCTVRDFRFAACRIFFCKADTEPQNQLSEETIAKFKSICNKFNLPYHYADLRTALNSSEIRKKAMK
ncbi:MAG: hypothetical protein JW806_01745 [Sedimentisphaerales bacterium]|nr:hypothetical protein [Sedimentisphaerales bacterium]